MVTTTVYLSDGVTVKSEVTGTADAEGRYSLSASFEEGDIIVVELAGGKMMSRTVDHLTQDIDPANDRITGEAPVGAIVRGIYPNDLTPLGGRAVQVTATVDATGVYTLDFGGITDVMPGQWTGALIADAEGDAALAGDESQHGAAHGHAGGRQPH